MDGGAGAGVAACAAGTNFAGADADSGLAHALELYARVSGVCAMRSSNLQTLYCTTRRRWRSCTHRPRRFGHLRLKREVIMRHSRSLRWLVVMVVVLAVHAAIFAGLMQWRSASSVPQTNGIEVQAETSSAAVGQGGEDAKNPAIGVG